MSDEQDGKQIPRKDIPIGKLVPRSAPTVRPKYRRRLKTSLRTVGLMEPLIVYPQDDHYEILDGVLRSDILLELGVETVPCLIWDEQADIPSGT
jgi:ParB-like chromosome segregation protein Spo0J